MTHGELRIKFISWYQKEFPDRRIFDNRTGWAQYGKQAVPYGIPAPARGRRKKAGGGGPDLISFGNEYGYFTAHFFELKTKNDRIRPNQKLFADWVKRNGGVYFIVREDGNGFNVAEY